MSFRHQQTIDKLKTRIRYSMDFQFFFTLLSKIYRIHWTIYKVVRRFIGSLSSLEAIKTSPWIRSCPSPLGIRRNLIPVLQNQSHTKSHESLADWFDINKLGKLRRKSIEELSELFRFLRIITEGSLWTKKLSSIFMLEISPCAE